MTKLSESETSDSTQMSKTPYPGAEDESTVEWLNRLLGGSVASKDAASGSSTQVEYLYRPNAAHPTLLIPIGHRAVTASALRRFHDSRTKQMTAINLASPFIGHAHVARRVGGEVRRHPQFELIDYLAMKLGEPALFASVILGPKRRNRKPVIQLIRPDGIVVGFAKLGWSDLTKRLVQNECEILRSTEATFPHPIQAPRVLLEETTPDGRQIVVTSAVQNGPFARRKGPLSLDFVLSLARSLSGGMLPISQLPYADMWRQNSIVGPFVDRAISVHGADSRLEVGLWHGDLTPWNTSTTRRKMAIWDWEFAGKDRPIGFDLLHDVFETHRRTEGTDLDAALRSMVADGTTRLSTLTESTDTIIDLYLCELLYRELELEGQRWESATVQKSADALQHLLTQRLGGDNR